MKQFFLSTLSFVTLSLIMASCGGDDQNGAYLKNFKVQLSDITETSVHVEVSSADEAAYFAFEVMKAADFFSMSRDEIQQFIQKEYGTKPFPGNLSYSETAYTFGDLDPGVNYVVFFVKVAQGYTLDGDVEWIAFKTTVVEGLLPGKFSVGQGQQVRFSKGNLQYNAMQGTYKTPDGKEIKGTWRFAENQWDVIGTSNTNISETYNGWIDLFGWGTTGFDKKYPWMTSTETTEYGASGIYYDWGWYNPISNGGNKAGKWRGLTNSERQYLLMLRQNKAAMAVVNNILGLVLLPDEWTAPAGIEFVVKPVSEAREKNKYDINQWKQMEANGAVFLPCAGVREGTEVEKVNAEAYYWLADRYFWEFDADWAGQNNNIAGINMTYIGASVRLVQDVK